eukprot:2110359-Rhodomonas_salina.6
MGEEEWRREGKLDRERAGNDGWGRTLPKWVIGITPAYPHDVIVAKMNLEPEYIITVTTMISSRSGFRSHGIKTSCFRARGKSKCDDSMTALRSRKCSSQDEGEGERESERGPRWARQSEMKGKDVTRSKQGKRTQSEEEGELTRYWSRGRFDRGRQCHQKLGSGRRCISAE